ncbi:hypothetical protein XSR1_280034 [Xenorhabdus szentirmaii DSM 16338]|uniref:Uncharacterized protein n=1 Tax=Xenorhabdus szentirmaii DSM 16338 TaxID=1427518 RepID=W1IX28_9GAMM|nr:hypothetical protein XSR1_280034 [Xenorhabdus szentirmaii DSM 16338]
MVMVKLNTIHNIAILCFRLGATPEYDVALILNTIGIDDDRIQRCVCN